MDGGDAAALRARAREEARAFRAAWVGMAEILGRVEEAGTWRAWGFGDFAAYCRQELDLRPQTVAKLTRSLAFLAARGAGRPGPAQAPPALDVVDLLARAPSEANLPAEAIDRAAEEVIAGGDLSYSQVLRRLRQHDPEAFRQRGAAPAPPPAATAAVAADGQALKKTLAVAARLLELVEALPLGESPRRHVRALIRELKGVPAAAGGREVA